MCISLHKSLKNTAIALSARKRKERQAMRQVEDQCVGCTAMGLHCIGSSCPNRNVVRYYCDECGEEDTLYDFDNQELCIECIKKRLDVVSEEE